MPAGLLVLALFKQIQPIRPVLHHAASLTDILGMILGGTDLVRISMRKLCIDPDLWITDLVERRRNGRADAVPGETILITEALQCGIERIFAHLHSQIAGVRKEIALSGLDEFQHVTDNLDRLKGARHKADRREAISCAYAFPVATAFRPDAAIVPRFHAARHDE
jgi:hypothetical protein